MILKRATKKLRLNNIENIVVKKGLYGYYAYDIRLQYQTSHVYKTADEVVKSVMAGEVPVVPDKASRAAGLDNPPFSLVCLPARLAGRRKEKMK